MTRERTGIEKMCDMVDYFNHCDEAWLDHFTIPQLIAIYDYAMSDEFQHDMYPDAWEDRWLKHALKRVK